MGPNNNNSPSNQHDSADKCGLHVCLVITTIMKRFFAPFRKAKSSQANDLPERSVSSAHPCLSTPNHIPFHGQGLSDDHQSLEVMSIDMNKEVSDNTLKVTGSKLQKPSDLWKYDQSLMLQGRYQLDANFTTKYKLKQLLGEGSFGFVWIAERIRDQVEVVVKFILREKVPSGSWIFNSDLGLVPVEVHILKQVHHPNIIQFLDYFSDYRFVYLVTELFGTSWTWPNPKIDLEKNPGLRPSSQLIQLSQSNAKGSVGVQGITRRSPCDLFECIEAHTKLGDVAIKKILSQILDAVTYLYSLGIVHRDLKDENIVINEDYHIKLVDFGSANFVPIRHPNGRARSGNLNLSGLLVQEGHFEQFSGTVAFAAPEIIKGQKYRPSEAEVWSIGVLLYTIIYKRSPFTSTDAILTKPLDIGGVDSNSVQDLLLKMLQKNPHNRIKLDQIQFHPFLMNKGLPN